MFLPTSTTLALASLLFPSRAAGYVQFYELTSQLGFALSTTSNGSSTDLLFQLSVPERAGWGAVGLGDVMDGSLMFIVYPSSNKQSKCQAQTLLLYLTDRSARCDAERQNCEVSQVYV